MPRAKDPNRKVQMTVRIRPDLHRLMAYAIEQNDRFENRSDLVGQAVEALLTSDPSSSDASRSR